MLVLTLLDVRAKVHTSQLSDANLYANVAFEVLYYIAIKMIDVQTLSLSTQSNIDLFFAVFEFSFYESSQLMQIDSENITNKWLR